MFRCITGPNVEVDKLCDGNDDCGNGRDETTALCEYKCRMPYHGSCPLTRECFSSDLDVNCGDCLNGFAHDSNNTAGNCTVATFRFSMTSFSAVEGALILSGSVILDTAGELEQNILVQVETVAMGTASVNVDYTSQVVNLTFPIGSGGGIEMQFNITIIDDNLVENMETFGLSASSVTDTFTADPVFSAGGDTATGIILDDDRVTISLIPPSDPTVPEQGGPVQFCFQIDNPSGQMLLEKSVNMIFNTSDGAPGVLGATSPADYTSVSQILTFDIGDEYNMLCVDIPIVDDDICEYNESFLISWSSTDDCVNIESGNGTVTIIDDDVAYIRPYNDYIYYNVTELLDEYVWIPLRLDGDKGPGQQCVVEVRTMDGTATAEMDYTSLYTFLTFDNDNKNQYIHIEILDDTICEGYEKFYVYLNTESDGCRLHVYNLTVWIWDDEVHFGDDPHFSIALPGGKLLCYTVQGEHDFSFNLISNKNIVMNSKFVPDSRREEVTWLGSMGIIIQDSNNEGSNATKLRFEALKKNIFIGDKIELRAKNVEKLTFSKGKLTISEAPPSTGFHYPSVHVDLQDVEISFTIKFTNEHLDMYWHSTGKKITDSHGLIGQFFRQGVEIDEARKILIMPGKEPIPVMRRPVWSFMERVEKDDQLCWTAMNPGYQGEGLIDGSYFDYLVDDIMSTEFKYKKQ